jgi:hypothetical protein
MSKIKGYVSTFFINYSLQGGWGKCLLIQRKSGAIFAIFQMNPF